MSILDSVVNIATGGLAKTALSIAEKWFPPSMSEADKQQAALAFESLELERQKATNQAISQATQDLTDRIAQLEGTASELQSLPIVGRMVLFARGAQRPVWGFATLWMDYQWFSGNWHTLTANQETALIVINALVLGFLFGERAVKNLMPLILRVLGPKIS